MKKQPLGLYFHVPFCDGKCPYCDFYSLPVHAEKMEAYTRAVMEEIGAYRGEARPVDTVYFGGGTPNLLGEARLIRVLNAAGSVFSLSPNAEITVEVNPVHVDAAFFKALRAAGFNRISMGMQSANPRELELLGRRHSPEDVVRAVEAARTGGFTNISLDVMLALPEMTKASLHSSIDFAAGLQVQHISAYILKVEEGTAFYAKRETMGLKADDEAAEFYAETVAALREHGYAQYEISNFSKPGFESRHNLCYWRCGEYLGFGPAAYGFYNGERFHHSPSLAAYLQGEPVQSDGSGGDFEEFVMLGLRLAEGISRQEACARDPDGGMRFDRLLARAAYCPPAYLQTTAERIALTESGFAVSNAILAVLLEVE